MGTDTINAKVIYDPEWRSWTLRVMRDGKLLYGSDTCRNETEAVQEIKYAEEFLGVKINGYTKETC